MVWEWVENKATAVSYDDAESFCYFMDKYTTIIIGGQWAMDKFYKDNWSKILFDKITASDIAYSVLVYESAFEVGKEEIQRSLMCKTAEEQKLFPQTAVLKYHVKWGTCIPLFHDGCVGRCTDIMPGLHVDAHGAAGIFIYWNVHNCMVVGVPELPCSL